MLDSELTHSSNIQEGEADYFEEKLRSKNGPTHFRETNEQLVQAEAKAKRMLAQGVSSQEAKHLNMLINSFAESRKILHILWSNLQR